MDIEEVSPINREETEVDSISPVRLRLEYPEKYSRLELPFKWIISIVLYIGLGLYSLIAYAAMFLAFWAILIIGHLPKGLFNFIVEYLEFQLKVYTFFPLFMADNLPSEELYLNVKNPEKLSRLVLPFVKLPLFLLEIVLFLTGLVVLFLGVMTIPIWWIILIRGRYPRKMFDFNVKVLNWMAGITAWQYLMRDDWSLFGRSKPVKTVVVIALVLLLAFSVFVFFRPIRGYSTLTSWLGAEWMITQGEEVINQFLEKAREEDVNSILETMVATNIDREELKDLLSRYRIIIRQSESVDCEHWEYISLDRHTYLCLEGQVYGEYPTEELFSATLNKVDGNWKITGIEFKTGHPWR